MNEEGWEYLFSCYYSSLFVCDTPGHNIGFLPSRTRLFLNPTNSQWSTSSWTNQQSPLFQRAGAHVNAQLKSDSSLHTIGLLCCLLQVSFQLTSLIGYRMRAFIWLDESNVIFQSCSVVKYCILCQYVSDWKRKGKKNYKNNCWNENEQKKKFWKNEEQKPGQPTEFFSLLCFVFFIYKKGKHQKWCLNTVEEIVGRGGVGHFSKWLNTSECLQHACTLIWALTFDLPSRVSALWKQVNYLRMFYSISL